MKKFTALFAATAVALTAAGCSADFLNADTADNFFDGIMDAAGGVLNGAMGETAADACIADGEPAVPSASFDTAEGGDIPTYGSENFVEPQAGVLTGGEWKDNDHWSEWNALYESRKDWNEFKTSWRIGWDERVCVKVTANGVPLENAKVNSENALFYSITNNKDIAYLFFNSENGNPKSIKVEYNGEVKTISQLPESGEITVEFDSEAPSQKSLDLMIVCDTTGSMSDELEYLKAELSDIIKRIKSENANLPTRVSVNFYRDEGDDYVVRPFEFTTDINSAVSQINAQSANGGGDTPEAVHTALNNAVNEHSWSEGSIKIMFLVLDAPAHNDAQIIDSLNKYVADAAEKGIRIIPVASSGTDKSTEYLLRTMAIQTGGTYTFLTNDSGIGGDHIEPTVGAYNVEKLGDMMVRIVGEYLGS